MATLSTHYSQNFNHEDLYQFCPNPLNFICHEKIPALIENDFKLVRELLHDINTANISERKQSRLSFGVQSSGNLFNLELDSIQELKKIIGLKIVGLIFSRSKF